MAEVSFKRGHNEHFQENTESDINDLTGSRFCAFLDSTTQSSDWEANYHCKRASKDGIDRTISSVSSLIGSYTNELDAALPMEPWIKQRLTEMEAKLETLLQRMAEEMAVEVEREQHHLMLMQDQVDKQGQILSRQVAELHRQMERESTRNSFVTSSVRESKEALADKIERQGAEIELLRSRLVDLEAPFLVRAAKSFVDFCWSRCYMPSGRLLPSQAFQTAQRACCSPVKPALPE